MGFNSLLGFRISLGSNDFRIVNLMGFNSLLGFLISLGSNDWSFLSVSLVFFPVCCLDGIHHFSFSVLIKLISITAGPIGSTRHAWSPASAGLPSSPSTPLPFLLHSPGKAICLPSCKNPSVILGFAPALSQPPSLLSLPMKKLCSLCFCSPVLFPVNTGKVRHLAWTLALNTAYGSYWSSDPILAFLPVHCLHGTVTRVIFLKRNRAGILLLKL